MIILQASFFLISDQHSFSLQALSKANVEPELVLRDDEEMEGIALSHRNRVDRRHLELFERRVQGLLVDVVLVNATRGSDCTGNSSLIDGHYFRELVTESA